MLRYCVLFVFVNFLTIPLSQAQGTVIKHKQAVGNTTWTLDGSPYYVQGEAIVPEGQTLRIEPGVEVLFKASEDVRFAGEYNQWKNVPAFYLETLQVGMLHVYGNLLATGSEDQPITFKANGPGYWGCIAFEPGNGGAIMRHCIVEGAYTVGGISDTFEPMDDFGGAISAFWRPLDLFGVTCRQNLKNGIVLVANLYEAPVVSSIDHCLLAYNGWAGLSAWYKASATLNHCTIDGHKKGISFNSNGGLKVANSLITDNRMAYECYTSHTTDDIEFRHSLLNPSYSQQDGNGALLSHPSVLKGVEAGYQNAGDEMLDNDDPLNYGLKPGSPALTASASGGYIGAIMPGQSKPGAGAKPISPSQSSDGNTEQPVGFVGEEGVTSTGADEPLRAGAGAGGSSTAADLRLGKYYALLVGVNNYQDGAITDLANPQTDARMLSNVLQLEYTFAPGNIRVLQDPTRNALLDALHQYEDILTANDNLLIFYAGHGSFNEEKQQGYWWPADARKGKVYTYVSNSDIRDFVRGIPARHVLIISDACFSGGIFSGRGATEDLAAIDELVKRKSRRAMTSGARNEMVPDKSVFVYYLLKRLQENDKTILDSQSLFTSMRLAVVRNSETTPSDGFIKNAGDEGGDFIFIRKE